MNTGDKLMLWPQEAPYEEACGGQARPSLTAFLAEGSPDAVVVIPGGGYCHKAEHEGAPVAQMLAQGGMSAFVLDYRVAPCPTQAPLADAARAVRLLRERGYRKVGVLGFSAGGHLACMTATGFDAGDPSSGDPAERRSSRPDALIACYSVVSLVSHTHIGSRRALLGEGWESDALARAYSAELRVTPDAPPAFIWHTADDESVPVENALMLAGAYAACGVPVELHIFPHGRHGLGLATQEAPHVAQWAALCQRWLREQGFGKPV